MNAMRMEPVVMAEQLASLSDRAREIAVVSGEPVVSVLERLSGLDELSFAFALGEFSGAPCMSSQELGTYTPAFDVMSCMECSRRGCIALRDACGGVSFALFDPLDEDTRARALVAAGASVRWRSVSSRDGKEWLGLHESTLSALDDVSGSMVPDVPRRRDAGSEDISLARIGAEESLVVRLVNSMLHDALQTGASDVHLETTDAGLAVKYRLDGVLVPVRDLGDMELAERVISRVKVMSELDISERRLPQDGRMRVRLGERHVDFRISVMPSLHGEDAVLRVLDRWQVSANPAALTLEGLGFDAATLHGLRRLARAPHGMMLVTGPTGSGKTTTLYAALNEINDGRDKIVTIEDPVEYRIAGVLQVPVNERTGLTFARGLRSILRHDPDRIMVGEIRDPETAQIAVQAALTGHLVFSTVHANGMFDVLGRFLHMGLDPYNFVSAVNGVVAQRLVRLNCPDCTAEIAPGAEDLRGLQQEGLDATEFRFRSGRGCDACRDTGYRGRTAIAEHVVFDDGMRELVIARAPIGRLRDAARASGAVFLREAALRLVRTGVTDLREANRVTAVV